MKLIVILLVILPFIVSVFEKISNPNKTIEIITKANIPYPIFAYVGSILFIFFGCWFIIKYHLGYGEKKYLSIGKLMLITFTVLATWYFHNILIDKSQKNNFLKNLSIIGGILLI